jgi:hypothetical protein
MVKHNDHGELSFHFTIVPSTCKSIGEKILMDKEYLLIISKGIYIQGKD